jgi:hypothetical protein
MFIKALIASVVIFIVMTAWVFISRWVAKSRAGDECTIPNQECGHCIMVDTCPMAGDSGPDDGGPAPSGDAEG